MGDGVHMYLSRYRQQSMALSTQKLSHIELLMLSRRRFHPNCFTLKRDFSLV
jgi:hypothetical protein